MPTLKFVIRENNNMKQDGTCPIFMRVTKDRKKTFISTGYHTLPKDWDNGIKHTHPQYSRLTALLNDRKKVAWNKIMKAEEANPNVTIGQLRAILSSKSEGNDYVEYAEEYIKTFSGNTLKGYETTLKLFKAWCPVLSFEGLTFEVLRKYEAHLKRKGNSTNTIATAFKRIKSILYAAYKDGRADRNTNPFDHFKSKWEKGNKDYLTEQEITMLRNLKVEIPEVIKARDFFLFQYNAWGMRVSDVLALKWEHIKGGNIVYRMKKTGTVKIIALTPEALKIIGERGTGYVFDYMKRYSNSESANSEINSGLKAAGQLARINKHITTHVARHTFTAKAVTKGIHPRIVQQLLGHSDIQTTMGYMQTFPQKELDEANKVIVG